MHICCAGKKDEEEQVGTHQNNMINFFRIQPFAKKQADAVNDDKKNNKLPEKWFTCFVVHLYSEMLLYLIPIKFFVCRAHYTNPSPALLFQLLLKLYPS